MIDTTKQKYMIQCSSGDGANPKDIGKPVIVHFEKPENFDTEGYDFKHKRYTCYWEVFPGIDFYLSTQIDYSCYTGKKYFKSDPNMFRNPTPEEIIKWNLITESLLTTIL